VVRRILREYIERTVAPDLSKSPRELMTAAQISAAIKESIALVP
jgi:hypothetical protein